MSSLKDLASTGRTICAVVHQPRSSIFAMVDELKLLSEGRMIYSGAAKDADEHFRRQGQ
jgi:ABC-type multidrug transport system ATPase subunit